MLERFAAWCDPSPGMRTLDVGTGPGLLPALLAKLGCGAAGVDLDQKMVAQSIHPHVSRSDARRLPFPSGCFDLVTASNVLYLDLSPVTMLREMKRVMHPDGMVAVLNPSENISVAAAIHLADERGLTGLARETLINFASRAEENHRWSEADLEQLFKAAGLRLQDTRLSMGPGFVRFARGALDREA